MTEINFCHEWDLNLQPVDRQTSVLLLSYRLHYMTNDEKN